MIRLLFLSILLLFPLYAFSQDEEFQSGAFYVYSGAPEDQYVGKLIQGKTYLVDSAFSLLPNTNAESILYFSNELIVKTSTNTTLNVVTFDQQILDVRNQPSRLKWAKHSLVFNLVNGEVVINNNTDHPESSTVINTSFGDVEIIGFVNVYISVTDCLKVFCYAGKVTVYSNRGNGDVAEKLKELIVTKNQFPMRGDNRKYIVLKREPDRGESSLLYSKLPKDSELNVRNDVFFALINKIPVGINIH